MTRTRTRWLSLAAALLLILGVAGAAAAVQNTQSAWTDKTHASAVATGGTWVTPVNAVSCTAMNANGTVKAGGHCTVTSVVVAAEWGSAPNRMRNYTATFNSNAAEGYVQFTINLSTGGGASNFSWTNAGLVASGSQATPNGGWTCAQLPMFTGKTPTGWGWGASGSIFFQITENRSSTAVNCG